MAPMAQARMNSFIFFNEKEVGFVLEIANAFQKYVFQGARPLRLEEDIKLSRIIWNQYGNERSGEFMCPYCKKPICRCPILLVQNSSNYGRMVGYASCNSLSRTAESRAKPLFLTAGEVGR